MTCRECQGNPFEATCSADHHAPPYRRIEISVFLGVTDGQAANGDDSGDLPGLPQQEKGKWHNANTWAGVRRHIAQANVGAGLEDDSQRPAAAAADVNSALQPLNPAFQSDQQVMQQLASEQMSLQPFVGVEAPTHLDTPYDVDLGVGTADLSILNGLEYDPSLQLVHVPSDFEFGVANTGPENGAIKTDQYLGQSPRYNQHEHYQQQYQQQYRQHPQLAAAHPQTNFFVQPQQILGVDGLQIYHNSSAVPSPGLCGSAWTSRAVTPSCAPRSVPAASSVPTQDDENTPKKKPSAKPSRTRKSLPAGSSNRQPRKRLQPASKTIKRNTDAEQMNMPAHDSGPIHVTSPGQEVSSPHDRSRACPVERFQMSNNVPGDALDEIAGAMSAVFHEEDVIEQRLLNHVGQEITRRPDAASNPIFLMENDVETQDDSLPSEELQFSHEYLDDLDLEMIS